MKTLLSILPLFLSATIFSQSIDEDWISSIGDSSSFKKVDLDYILDSGMEGVNVIWDFSDIQADPKMVNDVVSFTDVSDFGANTFSEISTLAAAYSNINGTQKIEYFNLVDNSLLFLGDSSLSGSKRVFDPPVTHFSFPWEFNEVINSSSVISVFDNLGELGFENTAEISRTFDGLGTLITPYGTFEDCIRIKEEFIAQPESQNPLLYERYSWYYNKLSNEMARISITAFLNISSFEWQNNVNEGSTSSQNIKRENPLVQHFLNNQFKVKHINGRFSIVVFDVLGRQIESQIMEFNREGTSFTLDKSYDTSNMYFMLFVNTQTNDFFIHRFRS